MYNEAKKLEWIVDAERRNALSRRSVTMSHLMSLSNAIEERLNADVFDLLRNGQKDAIIATGNRYLGFTTYSTIRRFVQTVNAYTDWRFAVDAGAIPDANQRLATYDFSLVQAFSDPFYIKTEDQLAAELSHHRIEDGDLLPVFASLAWIGYAPKDMVALRQCDVDDTGDHILVNGKTVNDGFVNTTLLYYSRTVRYTKPAFIETCIKEDGPEFLRNIVTASNPRAKANMLTKVRDVACKTTLLSGGTLIYSQLVQAGGFQKWLDVECNGERVDVEWIQQHQRVNGLTAKEHAQEFIDYKSAISIT